LSSTRCCGSPMCARRSSKALMAWSSIPQAYGRGRSRRTGGIAG
jgi:hypothetical protein